MMLLGRRTTRSSGRTRASRRLLRQCKRLAAHRSAERVRWADLAVDSADGCLTKCEPSSQP